MDAMAMDQTNTAQSAGFDKTIVGIKGMTCGSCTSAVESAFANHPGIVKFDISLLAERAVILHDPSQITTDQILASIDDRGFDAAIISTASGRTTEALLRLKLYSLLSATSVLQLEETLRGVAGVKSVCVEFPTGQRLAGSAAITYATSVTGIRRIVEAVEDAGHTAILADTHDDNAQLDSLTKVRQTQQWYRMFRVSLLFTIPILLLKVVLPALSEKLDVGSIRIARGLWLGDIVCLMLALPVQFGVGWAFYVSALKSLRSGSPNMDVLITLGTSVSFLFGCIAMAVSLVAPPYSRPATMFDTSTMLLTFVTLGRFLEIRAKGQTSKALSKMMSLKPSQTTIYVDRIEARTVLHRLSLGADGPTEPAGTSLQTKNIPSELLEPGDVVLLRPGDRIPADGEVIRGEGRVDESMVTGEASPVQKRKASILLAGTVNETGAIDFTVTSAGRDTQLGQIVQMVQEAQMGRAEIQRVADVVAGYFVPIIIALALLTFVGWLILSTFQSHPPAIFLIDRSGGRLMVCIQLFTAVIVVACPCALSLATPTAVMVGTGVGATHGILIKGGASLEKAAAVTHVVFDKTGTLTYGKMALSHARIAKAWSSHPEDKNLWWILVGVTENRSEHPIGKAIYDGAKHRLGVDPNDPLGDGAENICITPGSGISATVRPHAASPHSQYRVLLGNRTFLHKNGVDLPEKKASEKHESSQWRRLGSDEILQARKSAGIATTTVYVAINDEYAGCIDLSDGLKPYARECIEALGRLGAAVSLVTGDELEAAHKVASVAGIPRENVFAGVLPSGKKDIVEDLQRRRQVVAMVGDGINDSPALASADVGISFSGGTDVAVETADVVLMNPDRLLDIPSSLHLSKTIFRRIKGNLIFSCMYNAIALPVAMGALLPWGVMLPPLVAGAAMVCSSLSVVASSLLLKRWRRPAWVVQEHMAFLQEQSYWRRTLERVAKIKLSLHQLSWSRGWTSTKPHGGYNKAEISEVA